MPIQLECPGCKATLNVPDEAAGKAGKCIHCGQRVVVPGSPVSPAKSMGGGLMPTLFEATPESMVLELSRRQDSAVLLVFRPEEGSYNLEDIPESEIKCICTKDIDAGRLAEFAESFAKRFGPRDKSVGPPPQQVPYELKGDRLGMSLEDFKKKYARTVESTHATLPLCSDTAWGANKASLHSEPWHRDAGIIYARVDLPSEDDSPSVAGVKTELLLYQFVDGRLFRITALFPTDQFHVVSEAAVKKYGQIMRETQKPRQLLWENDVAEIVLLRGTVHPPAPSAMHLIHKALVKVADSRKPKDTQDI